ncbi:MAG: hypothetical protein D6798_02420 [Deltaproteobacteria bacterium]|nr:MAG: hypothetical protein D6798_02420 [Deltaproteobacteria bacterium]
MEQLFGERNYGILSQSQVRRAIARNNANAMADLPGILSAFRLSTRPAYDEEVVQRIAEFQQNFYRRESAGTPDGIVGPNTRRLIESYYRRVDPGEVDATVLWPPAGASIDQQYDHYARLATLFGNAPTKGQPLVIGIRGVMEFAGATHEVKDINAYDDTYVMILHADDGKGVWTFAGATHAYQATSGFSPNADGRGGGDVGSLRPTHDGQSYTLEHRGNYHGRQSLGIRSDPTQWGASKTPGWWNLGTVPVDRDTNHDRIISDAEATASRQRRTTGRGGRDATRQIYNGVGDYSTVTWWHPGFTETKDTGDRFASIGCLTAREEDVDNVIAIMRQTGQNARMIIIEAEEAVRRLTAASGGGARSGTSTGGGQ